MSMENIIIVIILTAVVALALVRTRRHFRGGGCCGSGGGTIRIRKELKEPKLGEKVIGVEGMSCANCQARIENVINQLDGAACTVDLKKKIAVVAYSRPLDDSLLRDRINALGYRVTCIR